MKRYQQYMYSYPHKTAYRFLDGVSIKEYFKELWNQQDNGLYVHIPFCEQKCGYCNLFSVVGQSEAQMDAYLDAMEHQLHAYQSVWTKDGMVPEFSSLTIGGGTPLLLEEHQLIRMFEMAEKACCFTKERMCVIETSPNQTTKEKLRILKQFGVNRVSIGVQSFDEQELRALHRQHTASRAKQALEWIGEEGFDCVNLDLIYGIPNQTIQSLEASVRQALEFHPDEIFAYPLYIKSGVWLDGKAVLDEENAYESYQVLKTMLKNAGYRQDSMRRFVYTGKNQEEIEHTMKKDAMEEDRIQECGFGNTLSVGCGGRSYLGTLHFCTPYAVKQETCRKILHQYIKEPVQWERPFGYLLSLEEQKRRYVIKHVLFGVGISKERYHAHFGEQVEEKFPILTEWKDAGYVKEQQGCLRLTEEGLAYSDKLGPMLISDEVRQKMLEWQQGRCVIDKKKEI